MPRYGGGASVASPKNPFSYLLVKTLARGWMRVCKKNGDFAHVGRKIKINRGLFGILWNSADPLHAFL